MNERKKNSIPKYKIIINKKKKSHKNYTHTDTEEQWEKDLDAELQEYEVVNDGTSPNKSNGKTSGSEDWEKDVDDLLGDSDDLK